MFQGWTESCGSGGGGRRGLRELEIPAGGGCAAGAAGARPQVEVVSSRWFSPCHKTQSI